MLAGGTGRFEPSTVELDGVHARDGVGLLDVQVGIVGDVTWPVL